MTSHVAQLPEPGPHGDLRTTTARGTIIAAAFSIALQGLGLLRGFAVAAFLTTSEYGLWGILVVTLGTLGWLKQVGISEKFVQQDETDQQTAFKKAFTLDLASNVALALVALGALPVFAALYGQPDLVAPGLVLVATLPVQSLRAPVWILYRDMRFARQRALDAVDPIVSFVVTIALAALGMGYWSLVIGFSAGIVSAAIAALAFSPYRIGLAFDRATLGEYFSFSWPLFVASASAMVIPQAAMLVGEASVGLAGAGVIALASTISIYTDKVDHIVTWTLYPAICRVKDRTPVLFEAFVKSNRLTLMWGVPFGVGLALFAPELVKFALGEKWAPAVGLIQAFGIVAALNHVAFNWAAFFRARGDTRPLATAAPLVLAAFLAFPLPLLIAFGLDGFAAGMLATTLVSLSVRAYYLRRLFPAFRMLRHASRALAPVVPGCALAVGCKLAIPDPSLAVALAEVAAFVVAVALATWVQEAPLLREVARYVRGRVAAA